MNSTLGNSGQMDSQVSVPESLPSCYTRGRLSVKQSKLSELSVKMIWSESSFARDPRTRPRTPRPTEWDKSNGERSLTSR